MTTRFRDIMALISPKALRNRWGANWMVATAGLFGDVVADLGLGAVAGPWLRSAMSPEDAVPKVGASRRLPQYPGESIEDYEARVNGAWVAYAYGGSEQAIIEQLLAYGFTPTLATAPLLTAWGATNLSALKSSGPGGTPNAVSFTETDDRLTARDIGAWYTPALISLTPGGTYGTEAIATTTGSSTSYWFASASAYKTTANESTRVVKELRAGTKSWIRISLLSGVATCWVNLTTGAVGASTSIEVRSVTWTGTHWRIEAYIDPFGAAEQVMFRACDADGSNTCTATASDVLFHFNEPVTLTDALEHYIEETLTDIPTDKQVEVRFLARVDAERPWLKIALTDNDDYVWVNTATRESGATATPGGQARVRAEHESPWTIVRALFWPRGGASDTVRISTGVGDEQEAYVGDGSAIEIADLTIGTPEPIILRDNEADAPDRINWWSQFWVIIPEGTHSYTASIPSEDEIGILGLVRKWKPAQWDLRSVRFITGGTVSALQDGLTNNEWAALLLPQDHTSLEVS